MKNAVSWFQLMKTANEDWGHGDTLHGQMKERETKTLIEKINKLKQKASIPASLGILPRWTGEIRRKIILLPPTSRLGNLSMYEINKLARKVKDIEEVMARYRVSRLQEILNSADNS
jgi:hypothetical protein